MQGSGGKHPCAQAVTSTVPYVVINRTFESVVYDCLRSANLFVLFSEVVARGKK